MQPSDVNFIKMKIHAMEAPKLSFQTKIPRPLSQAIASNHPHIFTFTLPLTEGRAGDVREPSNKMFAISFSLQIKCHSLMPRLSLSPLSLSLCMLRRVKVTANYAPLHNDTYRFVLKYAGTSTESV
jgi:hypothetical protein